MNVNEMMRQAQVMQEALKDLQKDLKDIEVAGECGGGLVRVTMTCDGFVKRVAIDPSIVRTDDLDALEALVAAAVNSAAETKDTQIQERTRALMKGMGLPDTSSLPGGT